MLRKLLIWALEDGEDDEDARRRAEEERRLDCRHDVAGAALPIRNRRIHSIFHLKNMSCRGACGISDMPLAVGSVIFVEVKSRRFQAAEVRWVRNALVGLHFVRPLDPGFLSRLPRARRSRGSMQAGARPAAAFTRR